MFFRIFFRRVGTVLMLATLAVATAGCGYRFTGEPFALDEDYRQMAIEAVDNPTLITDLSYRLRSRFRDELTKRDLATWVDRPSAKALVRLVIQSYSVSSRIASDTDQTLKRFRDFWYPSLLDRGRREQWLADGAVTLGQRLNARVREIVNEHQPKPLKAEMKQQLQEILAGF